MLTETLKLNIKNHAFLDIDQECCGIIVSVGGSLAALPCNNKAKNNQEHFRISDTDVIYASEMGEIAAYYHSHPKSNKISIFDKIVARQLQIPLITYFCQSQQFDIFYPEENFKEYIGRSFKLGVQDCFVLAKDFYKQEFGVDFLNYKYSEGWKESNPKLIQENIEKEGFSVVHRGQIKEIENLKPFDIILTGKIGKKEPEHIIIYLGGEKILSHPRNCLSGISELDKKTKRLTKYVIRHKDHEHFN